MLHYGRRGECARGDRADAAGYLDDDDDFGRSADAMHRIPAKRRSSAISASISGRIAGGPFGSSIGRELTTRTR